MGCSHKRELVSAVVGKKSEVLKYWKSPPTSQECLNYKCSCQLTLEET